MSGIIFSCAAAETVWVIGETICVCDRSFRKRHAPSAGHSKSRALSCSGDIEGFGLRDLHHRLHESSTNLTEDSCNFQARCMATRPLPVHEQITCLSEAGLPSRPRTEPAHASHMRTYLAIREAYLVIRARSARLARKTGRVGRFIFASRACHARLACRR